MSLCTFSGNADMYGLGIRLGYYLQWYGGMLATLLAPDEVGNARISLGFFISATFLALIIQTVRHQLYSIEIYIILLLTFGAYISLLPILLRRLLTRCDPYKDPTRFPLVDPGSIHSDLHSVLLLAVTGFQLWFWIAKVPELDSLYCKRYGFIFAKVPLNDKAFQVISIVVYFLLGVSVLVMLAHRINSLINGAHNNDEEDERFRIENQHSEEWLDRRVGPLQTLNLVQSVVTATVVVVATELTIKWNNVTGLNSLDSAGQLIPFRDRLGYFGPSILRLLEGGLSSPFHKTPATAETSASRGSSRNYVSTTTTTLVVQRSYCRRVVFAH